MGVFGVPTAHSAGGPLIVLDPGHNGGNAANPGELDRLVPAGRGNTKPCNTTGTSTDAGYPEHAFTWDVSLRVRDLLAARGVQVVMTRNDDAGFGPCVDERAAIGNRSVADAVVSIHADGATPTGAGFHVAHSAPPLNESQGEPSLRLAQAMRDAFVGSGFVPSNYAGSSGLQERADLAGLNLADRPAVLVECGNMRNPVEAAVLSAPEGRQRYAQAIADAIFQYVGA